MAFVREVTGLPPTSQWRRGDPVQGSNSAPGTAIATFNSAGRYPNSMSGDSHAAILVTEHHDGSLTVWDCWLNQPVHQRLIRNRHGQGNAVNDASQFDVIEVA